MNIRKFIFTQYFLTTSDRINYNSRTNWDVHTSTILYDTCLLHNFFNKENHPIFMEIPLKNYNCFYNITIMTIYYY